MNFSDFYFFFFQVVFVRFTEKVEDGILRTASQIEFPNSGKSFFVCLSLGV